MGASGPVLNLLLQQFVVRAAILALIGLSWSVVIAAVGRRPTWTAVVVAAIISIGLLAVPWASGRAPVAITILATTMAAVVVGVELPFVPGRPGVVAGLAVPVFAVGQVVWVRTGAPMPTCALLLAAGLVGVWSATSTSSQRLERSVVTSLGRFAESIGLALVVAVSTLILVVPGSIAGLRERSRRRRASADRRSSWNDVEVAVTSLVRDAPRPFASTARRLQVRRNAVGVVALAAAASVAVLVWSDRASTPAEPSTSASGQSTPTPSEVRTPFERARAVQLSTVPAFQDVPWADDLKAEQDRFSGGLVDDPVTVTRSPDFSGEYTNVVDGVRSTVRSECDGCPSATVWVVGGSAAFGLGQRDSHTIASELVRLADEAGIALDVTNLATPGWTFWQEVQAVRQRLESRPMPDAVVFLHGFNDVVGVAMEESLRGLGGEGPTLLRSADVVEFSGRGYDPADIDPAAVADESGRRMAELSRDADALLGPGRSLFVFQPDAFASRRQLDAVRNQFDVDMDGWQTVMDAAIAGAARSIASTHVDLRDVFGDDPPVFADLVHTNERGAAEMASAIWPDLRARLRDLGR